jgi:hypothetical protein
MSLTPLQFLGSRDTQILLIVFGGKGKGSCDVFSPYAYEIDADTLIVIVKQIEPVAPKLTLFKTG